VTKWRESSRDAEASTTSEEVRPRVPRSTRFTDEEGDSNGGRRSPVDGADELSADPPGFSLPSYGNSGQVWRDYNLAPYTNRLATLAHPEQAVVEWILRQTGPETWHGEDIAVLSATRGRLRVFHRGEVQDQVSEIVERFTRPVQAQVSLRVQFATTTDLNWRSGLIHLLKPVAYGSEGQQVWLIAPEDAALIRNRLPPDRSVAPLSQHISAKNGQETAVESGRSVTYISGLDLAGGTYLAYQPVVGRLQEGIKLILIPLWTADGSALDVVVKLTTRAVQKLHHAQGAAPLSSGNQETVMQVPEAVATTFDQTLRWPTSQVLLISAGIQPQNLTARRGAFGFGATATEMLLLVEVAPPFSSRPAAPRETAADR
jgi:hypothetical protein